MSTKAPKRKKQRPVVIEEKEPEPPPSPEPEAVVEEAVGLRADPGQCTVHGLDLNMTVRTPAEFTVVAKDINGRQRSSGGEAFFIAIRGASRVRARVSDCSNGTYQVQWKPVVSGEYSVAVSLFGVSLHGSPFPLHVYDPSPYAPNCEVSGEALNFVSARNSWSFDIRFRDRGGNVAQAVDLDVFVEPLPLETQGAAVYAQAWMSATRLCDEPESLSPVATTEVIDELAKEDRLQAVMKNRKRRTSVNTQAAAASATPATAATAADEQQITGDAGAAAASQVVDLEADGPPVGVGHRRNSFSYQRDPYYGSDDEDNEPRRGSAVASTTRQRAIRIRVGTRPLIVRARPELDSEQIGLLASGQTVTVIEERITEGFVRACVALEEPLQPLLPSGESGAMSPSTERPGTGRPNAVRLERLMETDTERRQLDVAPASVSAGDPAEQDLPAADKGAPADADTATAPAPEALSVQIDGSPATSPKRPPSPGSPSSPGSPKSPLLTGWVTLKKNGKKLVSSRLKLDTTARQQHMQQWERRLLNDKLKYDVASELAVDPTGVGYAFGGVHPGYLHAKGRLHEKHTVSYSVGRVGRYLLHVRLRQQALPVPGSPFALTVRPGVANHRATFLEPIQMPLRGAVGLTPEDGCKLVLQTVDVMGNVCSRGGAAVSTTCETDSVVADATDLNNGSYQLQWRSKLSGTFTCKVMIDKTQVKGSPIKIKLTSTIPDLSKCEIKGEGLKHAVAGEPASVRIYFVDSYGNCASPGPECMVGLGLTHDKKKLADVTSHDFDGGWGDEDSGEYLLSFIAHETGAFELHIWCDPTSRGERLPLPGSPFMVHVVPGVPTATQSHVEGFTKESRQADRGGGKSHKAQVSGDEKASDAKVIAGDQVSVRPLAVDEFGNSSKLLEGTMTALLVKPSGIEVVLSLLTTTLKTSGMAQYEVKCDTHDAGEHNIHVKLNGEPITGSPVSFEVHPAAPDPEHSRLIPPEDHDHLVPDYDSPSTVMLKTYDKFGNACNHGGLVPTGRLSLVKQSWDQTLLMPNNHFVTAEDLQNGTYAIRVGIKMSAIVKLFVNMDKNIPANGGELPALQIAFTTKDDRRPSAEEAAPAQEEGSFKDRISPYAPPAVKPNSAGVIPKDTSDSFQRRASAPGGVQRQDEAAFIEMVANLPEADATNEDDLTIAPKESAPTDADEAVADSVAKMTLDEPEREDSEGEAETKPPEKPNKAERSKNGDDKQQRRRNSVF